MFKIRQGVFETNSSSVHSMIMCNDKEYKKLDREELFIHPWNDSLMTFDEAVDRYYKDCSVYDAELFKQKSREEQIETLEENDVAYSLEGWLNRHEYCESFEQTYQTGSGEIIHAVGYYGNDY